MCVEVGSVQVDEARDRRRHMWVEIAVGSLPRSEKFFSGYSGFPLSSKTNISKFNFGQKKTLQHDF